MGLDMHLFAEKSLYHLPQPVKEQLATEIGGLGKYNITSISIEVLYWRKANYIHNWFVKNCIGTVDNCVKTSVTLEQLIELKLCIDAVIASPDKAKELLPPMDGFFFGSLELDDYYFHELDRTSKELDKFINYAKGSFDLSIYYYSSW